MATTANPRTTVSGKWVIAATLIGLPVVVLSFAAGAYLLAQRLQQQPQPLDWDARHDWSATPVLYVQLEKAGFLNPPGSGEYRDRPFTVSEQEKAKVMTLAVAAQGGEAAESLPDLAASDALADHFYSHYLRAQALAGDARDQAMREAFAQAPAAIRLSFVNPAGRPMPDLAVGSITLSFAIIEDGELDTSLRLTYPNVVSDAKGRVYLPVYDAPMKLIDPPEPEGWDLTWPRTGWFECVGEVGRVSDVTVLREREP